MINTSVNIAGVTLSNPVITASGTYGFGREYSNFYKLNELGAICVKGLTLKERAGNKPPRIAETACGILNSVGLQNPGVEYFIKNELPFLIGEGAKVIVNIAGNTIEEYCEMVKILSETETDLIELNISCPNVKEGGLAFGVKSDSVFKITNEVKKHCKKPLIVKLSPNVTDIVEIAKAARDGGADALSLINTLLGMKIDINTKKPILYNNVGGLSGPAILPIAVRMVWQVRNTVELPIIAMGGVSTYSDAIELMLVGANAVAVGTACFVDPFAPIKVRDGIANYLRESNIDDISKIVGSVIIN